MSESKQDPPNHKRTDDKTAKNSDDLKENWIVVFVAEDPIKANVIKAKLESEGIPTYVPEDFPSPHLLNRTEAGDPILVPREHAEKAGAIIKEHLGQ